MPRSSDTPRGSDDPTERLDDLEAAAWVLAAVIATHLEAGSTSLSEAIASDASRTAVLAAAGLVQRDGDDLVTHPLLETSATSASVAAAMLSSLRLAVAAAGSETTQGWAEQPDEVLLRQGRASAATGRAIAKRIVPDLTGLLERLSRPGGRVLDVGTGVGALAIALVQELPHVRVTAIDILDRAIRLARVELDGAGVDRDSIELRQQDAADLTEVDCYDMVWLPAPFLTVESLEATIPRCVQALAADGWIVVGTNPPPTTSLSSAVAQWKAHRSGGSGADADLIASILEDLGMGDVSRHRTFPGGPVLVAGRRTSGNNR
ncbi:SAM-dependent methyltransferase [Jatrophihabitans lederbergiae]|uniref:Class I SAM-dependent methyltransferase n=1 Tax=Jatrophihabitans lederbergiae TaxID=3075547 RepID=A0ABU2JF47_9ACTN|nr:class I SAM-dependent methyltransferase [Jatrophihabitans sp. DSM 44399]MDT0263353.1 class I SAM-dependent methyltransferase [Jatrophihabitans sp. DSM 44399]